MLEPDPALTVTVARGLSDPAAICPKYVAKLLASAPLASVGPSIASIRPRPLRHSEAACIGISQPGQSPDTVGTIRAAGADGELTVVVTNPPDSPMATASALCLPLQTGVEQSVAATKTFAASVLAGLEAMADWQQDAARQNAVKALPKAFATALTLDCARLAMRLRRSQMLGLLGRGPPIANEAAPKFKETRGLHAESFSAAKGLLGPSAIVQAQCPVRLPSPSVASWHALVAPLVLSGSFHAVIGTPARRRGFDPDAPPHLRNVTETT